MKKAVFIFVLVSFFGVYASSQSTIELDEKYGFKHFKFNTPISSYGKEIVLYDKEFVSNSEFKKTYKYVGDKIRNVFNVKIDMITLTFYKNKLSSIFIQLGNPQTAFTESEYDVLLYNLKLLYGLPISLETGVTGNFNTVSAHRWKGKRVKLEMVRNFYIPNQFFSGYIVLDELNIKKQQRQNEF